MTHLIMISSCLPLTTLMCMLGISPPKGGQQSKRDAEAGTPGQPASKLLRRAVEREATEANILQDKLMQAICKLLLTNVAQMRAMRAILPACHLIESKQVIVEVMEAAIRKWADAVQVLRHKRVPKRAQEQQAGLPHIHAWRALLAQIMTIAKTSNLEPVKIQLGTYTQHTPKSATADKPATEVIRSEVKCRRPPRTHT